MTAKKTYYEKLKDPKWQKKRLEVMEFNNFSCEICGDSESPLNVHHKEYFKSVEPWEYEINQLSCLCENCHERLHDEFDILKWVCSQAKLDGLGNREELAFLIAGYIGIEYESILSIAAMTDHRTRINPYKAGLIANKISSDGVKSDYLKESGGNNES